MDLKEDDHQKKRWEKDLMQPSIQQVDLKKEKRKNEI